MVPELAVGAADASVAAARRVERSMAVDVEGDC
jgi:hypothetical protein